MQEQPEQQGGEAKARAFWHPKGGRDKKQPAQPNPEVEQAARQFWKLDGEEPETGAPAEERPTAE